MRLTRVVVRFEETDKEGLDQLRERYFEETRVGLSRAAVVRILVRAGLTGAHQRKASEVLRDADVTASAHRSQPMPGAEKAARRRRGRS